MKKKKIILNLEFKPFLCMKKEIRLEIFHLLSLVINFLK